MALSSYKEPETFDDFHAHMTIQLGELIEGGFLVWGNDDWHWEGVEIDGTPSVAMHDAVCDMIEQRYYWREISIPQPGQWTQRFMYRIRHELVPKYQPLYQAEADGWKLLSDWDEYGKERNISSAYPETLLSANSDYLESGQDREFETVHNGNALDALQKYLEQYKSLNQSFVDELEPLFLHMVSSRVNFF